MEDESGVVNDITLTYVVIGLWDDRKLILPPSYFISQPFENWTRSGDRIGGTVFIDVDWTVPIAQIRAELEQALTDPALGWPHRIPQRRRRHRWAGPDPDRPERAGHQFPVWVERLRSGADDHIPPGAGWHRSAATADRVGATTP